MSRQLLALPMRLARMSHAEPIQASRCVLDVAAAEPRMSMLNVTSSFWVQLSWLNWFSRRKSALYDSPRTTPSLLFFRYRVVVLGVVVCPSATPVHRNGALAARAIDSRDLRDIRTGIEHRVCQPANRAQYVCF